MGFFDKLKKSKGGYIFLSHSHDDIEKVRKIRNKLEQEGFEPLCFYLKCLSDDDEVEDLIKREIDAREWFVFVDSENSRKSKWVTMEREYITGKDSKKIVTVDINDDVAVEKVLEKLVRNLKVFISFSHKDRSLFCKIKEKFEEKDYLVYSPESIVPSTEPWAKQIRSEIVEASQEGCVLALLTQTAMDSKWVKQEILYALEQKGLLIPIIVGKVEMDRTMEVLLGTVQHYFLSENPTDEEIELMIDQIGRVIVSK